jgi:hypothetical protein
MTKTGSNASGHLFDTSLTADGVIYADANGVLTSTSAGAATEVLTSNGPGVPPTFQAAGGGGNAAGFSAYASGNISNVSGDGTAYNILFDTTSLDTASAFNTGTGVYTFPFSGLWLITGTFAIFNVGAAHILGTIQLITTSLTQTPIYINPFAMSNGTQTIISYSTLIKVTAADTAYILFEAAGGTKTVGIIGAAGGFTFNGALINT